MGECKQWDPHAKDLKGRAELQGPDEVDVFWLLQVGISKRLSFSPDGVSLTLFSVSMLKAVLVGMSKKLIFAMIRWGGSDPPLVLNAKGC